MGHTKILLSPLYLQPRFSNWWHVSANSAAFLCVESWKVALVPFYDGTALGPL